MYSAKRKKPCKMENSGMPLYAIVELLIRLSAHHQGLGEYQYHIILDENVIVTTTEGSLQLSKGIVLKQIFSPATITNLELLESAYSFRKP